MLLCLLICFFAYCRALRSQLTADCVRQTLRHWADNVTTTTNATLIYWCDVDTHCGGIGDRMRSVIDLFFWAVALRRRFLIWMPKPVPLSDILEPVTYNWAIGGSQAPHCDLYWRHHKNASGGVFPDRDTASYAKFNTICVHTSQFFHARAVRSRKDLFGNAAGDASAFDAQFFGEAFRFLFRPSPHTWRVMDALRKEANLPALQWLRPQQWFAVHMRTALADDNERDSVADLHNITQCFLETAAALEWSGAVLVASDSAAAKSHLLHAIPGATSAAVHVVHVDANAVDVETEHVFAAWSEFLLLAHASCVVASRSGFSEWAVKATLTLGSVGCLIRWRQCETDLVQFRHNRHVDGSAFRFQWDKEKASKC